MVQLVLREQQIMLVVLLATTQAVLLLKRQMFQTMVLFKVMIMPARAAAPRPPPRRQANAHPENAPRTSCNSPFPAVRGSAAKSLPTTKSGTDRSSHAKAARACSARTTDSKWCGNYFVSPMILTSRCGYANAKPCFGSSV